MFPKPQDIPAVRLELPVYIPVAFHIPGDLVFPETGVLPGGTEMLRASMPKAAIHKNGDLLPGKNNIWSSCQVVSKSVSQTCRPECLSQQELRFCVLAPDTGHAATALLRCQNIRGHNTNGVLLFEQLNA